MCSRPRRRPEVNWIEIDGDVVATDPANGSVHVFRGAAAALWQLIDGEPLDGLEGLVAETFGLDADAVAQDLERALHLLSSADVIECADSADRR